MKACIWSLALVLVASGTPRKIDIRVIRGGQLTELHVDDDALRIESTAATSARRLTPPERSRIRAVASRAVASEGRNSCGKAGTFISVTVDGKTNSAAICREERRWDGPWRDLLEVVLALAQAK